MENSKSYLVITAIVNKVHIAELQTYLSGVMQVFEKNGGKPTGRFKTMEQLSGDDSPELTAIIAFPDAKTISDMVKGDDFLALTDIRARVFSKLNTMICTEL